MFYETLASPVKEKLPFSVFHRSRKQDCLFPTVGCVCVFSSTGIENKRLTAILGDFGYIMGKK